MTIIEKYLVREVGMGLLLAAAVLLPLFGFLELIEQLDEVGDGSYRTKDAFYYVLLLLPRRLVQLLPFIALIGNVVALGRLALHSEIISMRAAGLSPADISRASLKVGLALLLALVVLEQFVAPVLQHRAIAHRSEALNQSVELGEGLGIWARDKNRVVRLGEIAHLAAVQDVEVFTMSEEGTLSEYLYAAYARIISDEQWRLHDVVKKEFHDSGVVTTRVPQLGWQPFLGADGIATLTRPPESLAPLELYRYIRHLDETGQQPDALKLAFWRKFGAGLIMIAMLLLSVPFVFGSIRAGIALRLVLAGITGICVYLLDQILSNAGLLLGMNHALVALAPGLLLALLGRLWLGRIH